MAAFHDRFTIYGEANTFSAREGMQQPAYAASFTPDFTLGPTITILLTGNITINAPAPKGYLGQRVRFIFKQDSTGGRTVTWNSVYMTNWTPNTAAFKANVIDFECHTLNNEWIMVSGVTNL